MRCSTASVTVCLSICSRSIMRRRAFWRELADATTSHQFFVACTGFRWSSGSTTSWPLSSTSRCEVKLPRTWSTTVSWSRTPDAPASLCSRQRPHCSENKHSTWQQEFLGRGSNNLEQSPALLRQPDIELGHFKRLLKAFLVGETAAHKWHFDFNAPCISRFTYLLMVYCLP